jgi:hypothetical protein
MTMKFYQIYWHYETSTPRYYRVAYSALYYSYKKALAAAVDHYQSNPDGIADYGIRIVEG